MRWLLTLILSFHWVFCSLSFAQETSDLAETTKNDFLIVLAAGAGGAVLGLSTLSFYEKPSKHLSNIWTGAAIGIIAGVVVVALTSAQKGSENLVTKGIPSREFSTSERQLWHEESHQTLTSNFSYKAPQTTFWHHSF